MVEPLWRVRLALAVHRAAQGRHHRLDHALRQALRAGWILAYTGVAAGMRFVTQRDIVIKIQEEADVTMIRLFLG